MARPLGGTNPGEFCRLNIDVLSIIALDIHPTDLFSLARTCKYFRQLLTDRSSEFLWKAARKHVRGLPPCPPELTEQEYANLLFNARCHGCGKCPTAILWNVRRRYCPGCRALHLCRLSSCNEVIRGNKVLAEERVAVKKGFHMRVDKAHAASFMDEYRQSSDKQQFINDKQKQRSAILLHAKKCKAWFRNIKLIRQEDKQARRRAISGTSDIRSFGRPTIQGSREWDFKASNLLAVKERIKPAWIQIMEKFRLERHWLH